MTTHAVYNDEVKVLFFEGFRELAVLQSSLHDLWARWRAGTLGAATLRYSTTATLETWPMPRLTDELEEIGLRYATLRDELRLAESVGLTDLYNRFHDPAETSERIDALRNLHREMDFAVLRAFEWGDINLAHDFREVAYLPPNDRVRMTVSESAHAELLSRLTSLNHRRHAEEAAAGSKKASTGTSKMRRASSAQLDLATPAPNSASKAVATPANKAAARRTSR